MSPIRKVRARLRPLRAMIPSGGKCLRLVAIMREWVARTLRDVRVACTVTLKLGFSQLPCDSEAVVALAVIRDGEACLPGFLNHHRRLGVAHFVFLDNGSTDQTEKILAAQSDVTVFRSTLPFGEYKHAFRQFLQARYGRDRWTLMLDVDELFDFSGSDRINIRQFVSYLDEHGYDALVSYMLDRFADGPLLEQQPPADGDLDRAYRLYDLTGYERVEYRQFGPTNIISNPAIAGYVGGINRLLGNDDIVMTKHPLRRPKGALARSRDSHEARDARVADVTGVLYHFKYTWKFGRVLKRAISEESYYGGSLYYKARLEALERDPKLSLKGPKTRELRNIDQLVADGFLVTSPQYVSWLDRQAPLASRDAQLPPSARA